LLGAKLPEGVKSDGVSVLGVLKDGKASERKCFYWELHEGGGSIQAVRFGDWKAVRNGPSTVIELYDLKADPGETKNLAADRPEVVKKAGELLTSERTEHPDWPLKDRPKKK
jgi:arylsulfatase A-like enzyme